MSSPQKTTMFGWPFGIPHSLPRSLRRPDLGWRLDCAGRRTNDAAKTEVTHGRLDRLRRAGGRSISMAVVRSAQVRAALDDHPRELLTRLAGVVAPLRRCDPRVDPRPGRTTAGVDLRFRVSRRVEVGGPFPDVAGDVVQAVAVGREGAHRRRALELVQQQVLPGELALPRV